LISLDDIFGSYVLNARPSGDFNYEAAINKLVNLDLNADYAPKIVFRTPEDDLVSDQVSMSRQGRLMRLAGWIDLDSRLTVCFRPCRLQLS
jgi:DNA mismatch repair protein MSH5